MATKETPPNIHTNNRRPPPRIEDKLAAKARRKSLRNRPLPCTPNASSEPLYLPSRHQSVIVEKSRRTSIWTRDRTASHEFANRLAGFVNDDDANVTHLFSSDSIISPTGDRPSTPTSTRSLPSRASISRRTRPPPPPRSRRQLSRPVVPPPRPGSAPLVETPTSSSRSAFDFSMSQSETPEMRSGSLPPVTIRDHSQSPRSHSHTIDLHDQLDNLIDEGLPYFDDISMPDDDGSTYATMQRLVAWVRWHGAPAVRKQGDVVSKDEESISLREENARLRQKLAEYECIIGREKLQVKSALNPDTDQSVSTAKVSSEEEDSLSRNMKVRRSEKALL